MATKEVMTVHPDEFGNMVMSDRAMEAYRFALANAGIEMDEETEADFIIRRNARAEAFIDLVEVQKWFEKAAASIKEAVKHAFNVGDADSLPSCAKWSKQSYTYAFKDGAASYVARDLMEKGEASETQLLDCVTVTAMAKAAGWTTEKMLDKYPDCIEVKPKERSLTIK